MKYLITIILILAVALSLAPIWKANSKVDAIVSELTLGMTPGAVRDAVGPPTQTAGVGYPDVVGKVYMYSFPRWWDRAIWRLRSKRPYTLEGNPAIWNMPRCEIEFYGAGSSTVLVSVTRFKAYSSMGITVLQDPTYIEKVIEQSPEPISGR